MIETWNTRRSSESGDIITGWLLQVVIFLAVISFIAYEVISVLATTVSLDDTAREVARAARDEYRVTRSLDAASETAAEVADVRDAHVVELTEDGDDLIVELQRDAPTLVIHRIGPLQDLAKVNTSARVTWAP